MAGIDFLVNSRADAFAGNPQQLMQRYQQGQDLLDLLALQKMKTEKEAAVRSMQMAQGAPTSTIRDQREAEVLDMTKQEVAQQVAPGIAALGSRMAQDQFRQRAGIPSLPAPNMDAAPQLNRGGIVSLAEGGEVEADPNEVVGHDGQGEPITRAKYESVLELLEAKKANLPPSQEGVAALLDAPQSASRSPDSGSKVGVKDLGGYAAARKLGGTLARGIAGLARGIGGIAQGANLGTAMGAEIGDPEVAIPNRGAPIEVGPPVPPEAVQDSSPAPVAEAPVVEPTQAPDILDTLTTEEVLEVPTEIVQRASPEEQSAYARRIAELKAQEQDKLDVLIEFLLGAGASGGTNIGATLTGGGKALQNRDRRIKQEISSIEDKIETLKLKEQELGLEERGVAVQEGRLALDESIFEDTRQRAVDAASAETGLSAKEMSDYLAEWEKTNRDVVIGQLTEQVAKAKGKRAPNTPEGQAAIQEAYYQAMVAAARDHAAAVGAGVGAYGAGDRQFSQEDIDLVERYTNPTR